MEDLFLSAQSMQENIRTSGGKAQLCNRLIGDSAVNLFYESSTRTMTSFWKAGTNLGMDMMNVQDAGHFSSASKGETIADTVEMMVQYGFSAMIMRHTREGAAAKAVAAADNRITIINAGDGKGEHPTQALLDAYTIWSETGRLHGHNVVMSGDPKHGRTIRSLAKVLALYPGNKITFASPKEFAVDADIKHHLSNSGVVWSKSDSLDEAVHDATVVYQTRAQRERFAVPDTTSIHLDSALSGMLGNEQAELLSTILTERQKTELVAKQRSFSVQDPRFVVTPTTLDAMPKDAIIMHPLPRVGEIAPEVDRDPRAAYFRQAGNGLYTRMALLDHLLNQS